MDNFIRVWCSDGPNEHTWIHLRASAIVAVHEEKGRLKVESRRITFVIGNEIMRGSVEVPELHIAGFPVPDANTQTKPSWLRRAGAPSDSSGMR